ncbi:fibronectin type III domain-containing protein [Arcobacter porcinus]|uniref:Fibronectin type III domain protein n=1 Tax=Arcobacter porcinus TaxID=1935204 RepID=A0A1C0B0L8_9BACT|nr:fibronectin type III domain-containing protein [Arcobacter porcinus]OCL91416.1 Fibronectin type III domain protein [Aliarcobacter thereius]OCL82451.1 Fibronectin type III domain protein [Arcobacter porcinus]OCL82560.1 Fibronectin type III domain protein [Arcobacter porcinus]OCL93317.1 Fibronectin type III domain protein [Arcobacter porcinus]QEP40269.1 fibronectin type III domain-containing protein [Arcobacter porcinus]
MKKLIPTSFLILLTLVFSSCSSTLFNQNSEVDKTFQTVDYDSIISIPSMTSVGFEWKRVDDSRVEGYNFYRANADKNETKLKLIYSGKNKLESHYVDKNLEPNTKYIYQISVKLKDNKESLSTKAYLVQTLPRLEEVKFAQAISNLPRQVKIIWQPHPDKRVDYYEIERFNPSSKDWNVVSSKIKNRLSAEFIDSKLKDGTTYKYKVIAYTFESISSNPSEILEATTKSLPLPISNLKASDNIPKKIYLSWQTSSTSDVIYYDIYRSSYEKIGFSKIARVKADVAEYTDELKKDNQSFYYKIVSVDKDKLESTQDVSSVRGKSLIEPAKPVLTLAQIQDKKAILNWKEADDRAEAYNVIKKTKKNLFVTDTLVIKGIKGLRFEDKDVVSGVEYNYSVQAIDEFGLVSEPSNEAKIILPIAE